MNPDDRQLSQGGGEPQASNPQTTPNSAATPTNGQANGAVRQAPSLSLPQREGGTTVAQREAAVNVIRGNIENLYHSQGQVTQKDVQQAAQPQQQQEQNTNPYMRTHGEAATTQADQWKAYHTAWQDYYQKYYESYYHHHAQQTAKQTELPKEKYFSKTNEPQPVEEKEEPMTQDEALLDLRRSLLQEVGDSAKKVRRSRHFIPIVAGLAIVLIFVFIQYNSFITGTVAAYVSPGAGDVQDIVDPTSNVQVGPDPMLIIPKINVNVPVSYDIGNDYDSQMAAMKNGLAWFGIPGANSHPGQVGNTVLAGHSSNDLFDTGDYKFIFAQLDKLTNGDTIYANYKGTRYTYVVTSTKVVAPTDVGSLVLNTDKPILTLLTCTPVGTSKNRLLVFAEQVTPDPTQAASKPTDSGSSATTIPGANSPTLFEKLFGSNG
jgi:sortase A